MKLYLRSTITFLAFMLLVGCYTDNLIESSLDFAGENRQQLEKVLEHFNKVDDTERSGAAQWLIANMSGKEGCDTASILRRARLYQIVDSVNRLWKEPIDSIVKSYGADHSNVPKYKDLMCVDSAFLVNDIESAFFARERWQWAKKVDFDTFRDFVLPYRVGDEALFNNSRSVIQQQLLPQLLSPSLTQASRKLAILSYLKLSSEAIALLTDRPSINAVHAAKSRLKKTISEIGSMEAEIILKSL